MNQNQRPVFGADPEFFATYTKGKKQYCLPPVIFRTELGIPAEENGRHPIFLKCSEGQIVHEDGAAFELTVNPSSNWKNLFQEIQNALSEFNKKVLSRFSDIVNPTLQSLPTVGWEVKRWKDRGEDFDMATQFGCDPDQDLFNMQAQCLVIKAAKHPYRYGGGHIHMSNVALIESDPLQVLRMMVLTAGLTYAAYSPVPDLDRERTYLYGKPGKFRLQTYPNGEHGVEYRTPSNSWTGDISLAERIFTALEYGVSVLLPSNNVNPLMEEMQRDVTDAILSCNQEKAKGLLSYVMDKGG